ncbi:hypothetical protein DICPUDRAFT_82906 [Dictyostelium purpureum]|uniref:Rad60/SUMO-like domain-containing protein n=1 Tax=Dictyostelium purpureum TaxID=5786 RepID=F0ZXZ5_DICPU|nr:uncharacterized protein DICPUDRAFT_82906 [Dictyostelium purpureum]EGC31169.1 hypothetical protein DICPUDRAFT_82906 [Dictyostelium purpureum]|eukprot:XP_003292289.1 hypothetical protein DICPUDRAFT_82906 [Dictyostelium purpureum]
MQHTDSDGDEDYHINGKPISSLYLSELQNAVRSRGGRIPSNSSKANVLKQLKEIIKKERQTRSLSNSNHHGQSNINNHHNNSNIFNNHNIQINQSMFHHNNGNQIKNNHYLPNNNIILNNSNGGLNNINNNNSIFNNFNNNHNNFVNKHKKNNGQKNEFEIISNSSPSTSSPQSSPTPRPLSPPFSPSSLSPIPPSSTNTSPSQTYSPPQISIRPRLINQSNIPNHTNSNGFCREDLSDIKKINISSSSNSVGIKRHSSITSLCDLTDEEPIQHISNNNNNHNSYNHHNNMGPLANQTTTSAIILNDIHSTKKKKNSGDPFHLNNSENYISKNTFNEIDDLDRKLNSFNFISTINRLNLVNYGERLIREFKRFLIIKKITDDRLGNKTFGSSLIEELWLGIIVETQRYDELSDLIGAKFHYDPYIKKEQFEKNTERTIEIYKKIWPNTIDHEVWSIELNENNYQFDGNTDDSENEDNNNNCNSIHSLSSSNTFSLVRSLSISSPLKQSLPSLPSSLYHPFKPSPLSSSQNMTTSQRSEQIKIHFFENSGGNRFNTKIFSNQPLKKVMDGFSNQFNVQEPLDSLQFYFKGNLLSPNETPSFYKINEGDVISVIREKCKKGLF